MDRRSEARLCVHTPPLHHWESEETAGTEQASALITGLFEKLSAGSLLLCDALSSKCFHRQPTPSYTHTHTLHALHTLMQTLRYFQTLCEVTIYPHTRSCADVAKTAAWDVRATTATASVCVCVCLLVLAPQWGPAWVFPQRSDFIFGKWVYFGRSSLCCKTFWGFRLGFRVRIKLRLG